MSYAFAFMYDGEFERGPDHIDLEGIKNFLVWIPVCASTLPKVGYVDWLRRGDDTATFHVVRLARRGLFRGACIYRNCDRCHSDPIFSSHNVAPRQGVGRGSSNLVALPRS
jgi:hypothetical protein